MDVTEEIREIASYINNETINIRLEASQLAKDFEEVFSDPYYPADIGNVDARYTQKSQMLYLTDFQSEGGFKQILATGATPIDDTIKTKLIMIEGLYPKLSAIYRKYKYVDEVWYMDKQSVTGGNTEKNIMSLVNPGFNIGGEYERGEKPYSRFGIVGPEQNPEKKTLWSPDAFLEMFDEYVISAQTPVYVNNEYIGKISIHYNLIYLREDTIAKSQNSLMIISNQLSLIGMSPSAKTITHYTQYEKRRWESKKARVEYLNELNLTKQTKDFTAQIKALQPDNPGEYEFSGKKYQIYKEDIPEIGFQVLGLQ